MVILFNSNLWQRKSGVVHLIGNVLSWRKVLAGPMAYLVARLFGSYYVAKGRHDSKVLHYYRTPTWRSLVLFVGMFYNE